MNLDNYLLGKVSPEEFEKLRTHHAEIISDVMDGFNDFWKPKVKDIVVSFRYNPKRKLIGIYLNKDRDSRLVISNEGLTPEQIGVAASLYNALEKRLDMIRLPNENWISA